MLRQHVFTNLVKLFNEGIFHQHGNGEPTAPGRRKGSRPRRSVRRMPPT
jgi:hypothetical protein